MSKQRYPAVAGAFYPGDRFKLAAEVERLVASDVEPRPALGAMVPHAGYVYSGRCAGRTLASIRLPRRVVLLGPNHTGRGAALAACEESSWSTPIGPVPVAEELFEELGARVPALARDSRAHSSEHALEVQIPLLRALREDVEIAPIVIGTRDPATLAELGAGLGEVCRAAGEAPLIVISSDMTHYESAEVAAEKDAAALERLEAFDPGGLLDVVAARSISMCGAAPAAAGLHALRALGATEAERICYTHSGAVTGDEREVVAYAGVVFRA